jgi:hypothetical protein
MTSHNFNNASRKEREEVLRNEKRLRKGDREASTYLAQSMAGLDESDPRGGRYANQERYVTGSEAATRYPPASSPWSSSADVGLRQSTTTSAA